MSDVAVTFGAETGDLEAALVSAKTEISSLAKEMRSLDADMHKAGVSADSDLGQKLKAMGAEMAEAKAHMAELKNELKEHTKGAEEAEEGVARFKEALIQLAEIAGIELGVAAFKEWVSETTEAAEKVEQAAAKLGVSTHDVQALGAVSKLAGGDFEQMQMQLERLQLSLAKTGEKASPASAALHALGINVAEFRAQPITGQINEMAEAFSKFADGPTKTAVAMALLGKTGADMIPFLDKGREGLAELNGIAERTGVIMSRETIEALSGTREHLNELSLAWTALSQRLYAVVNPAIDAVIKELTLLVEHADPTALQGKIAALSSALVSGAAAVAKFAIEARVEWGKMVADIAASVGPIDAAGSAIADKLNALVNSSWFKSSPEYTATMQQSYANLFSKLGVISDEYRDKWKQAAYETYKAAMVGTGAFGALDVAGVKTQLTLQGIEDHAKSAKAAIAAMFDNPHAAEDAGMRGRGVGASEGEAAKPKPQVPQMSGLGGAGKQDHSAEREAEAEAQLEIDAAKRVATEKEKSLDEQLKTHKISMNRWLADTEAVLDSEYASVKASYDKELETAGLTSAQIINIKRKEAEALAEIAQKKRDDENKAAEASAAAWKSGADTIAGVMNSQVDGILKGTTSVSQAFKNMAASAIEDIIKFCVKWLAEHIATEASVVAAHASGVVATKAVDSTAISGDAARAAAGAYAAVAGVPIIGPILAPAAAAVAFGAVEAFGSYDTGAMNISHDQLAMVHAGEVVIPQRGGLADGFREMAAGGGFGKNVSVNPQINIHNNSIDSRSLKAMFNENGGSMAKAIHQASRHGAMLGLKGALR